MEFALFIYFYLALFWDILMAPFINCQKSFFIHFLIWPVGMILYLINTIMLKVKK